MEDKVLAIYVDDVLEQQYFFTMDAAVSILEVSKAIADLSRTLGKMKFEHISIWLKPVK